MYKTILSYCFRFRKNTDSKNPRVVKTENEKILISSNCAFCGCKRLSIIKEQETSELLGNLGTKTLLSQIPLLDPIFLEV